MSTPIQANIRYAADVSELKRNIAEGIGVVDALKSSVMRTVDSLGGNGLYTAANRAAAAIMELGGVTKLTQAEQDRYNALFQKTIEKAQIMGREVPQAWKDIASATSRVERPMSSLAEHLDQIQAKVKSFSGDRVIQEAHQLAIAVQQVGGASTLTATEMAQVNRAVTEAIAKYEALGQKAPENLLALEAATKRLDYAVEQVPAKVVALKDRLSQMSSIATTAGMTLSTMLTAPIVGVGAAAIKASMDYETAFSGVKKTVSGTPQELAAINEQFREMARTTPVSAVELAKIGETAGQLGVQKAKIIDFTKTIVDISVATNLTADEAGSSFARLANVMKMPQDQFSNLGSAVVALGNFGASTEQEMLSMAQRISAAGATAGMTAPQVLGIANALSSVGIEAEAGGTAVSKVIVKIATDVASGAGHLQTFARVAGMTSDEFSRAWRDNAGQAFSKFMQGLANVRESGGDQLLGLMDELGFNEVRLRNAFMSAANAGTLMADSITLGTKAFSENTELTRAAGERYKTTANQLKVLWNNLTDVAMTIGEALTPRLNDAVIAAKPFIATVAELAKWFLDLPVPVQLVAIALAGVAASIGPLLFVAGQLLQVGATLLPLLGSEVAGVGIAGAASAAGAAISTVLVPALLAIAIPFALYEVVKLLKEAKGLFDDMPNWRRNAEGVANTMRNEMATAAKLAGHEFKSYAEAHAFVTQRIKELRDVNPALAVDLTNVSVRMTVLADGTVKATRAVSDHAAATAGAAAGMAAAAARAKQYAADMEKLGAAGKQTVISEHEHGIALKKLATEFGVSEESLERLMKAHAETAKTVKQTDSAHLSFESSLKKVTQSIDAATAHHVPLTEQVKLYGAAAVKATEEARVWGSKVSGSVLAVAEAHTIMSLSVKEGMSALTQLGEHVKIAIPAEAELAKITEDLQKKLHLGLGGEIPGFKVADGFDAAAKKTKKAKDELDTLARSLAQLAQVSDGAFGSVVRDIATLVTAMDTAKKAGVAMREGLKEGGVDGMTKLAAGALAAAAAIGQVTAQGNTASRMLKGGLAGAEAGAAFGPWGAAIGGIAGAITGLIRGLTAGRDAVKDFAKSFGGFDDLHAKLLTLGDAGEALWVKLTQGVGRNNPEQAKQVIDEINKALAGQDAYMQRLPGLIEKYGLSWAGAGAQAKQAHLDEIARGLIQDFADLSRAGFDVTLITEKMSGAINDYVHQAMATGTEVPAAMRPLLQKMIELGTLTDASGSKITDLEGSGITFATTLTEGFKSVVDAIKELTKALGGVPDALNKIPDRKTIDVEFHGFKSGNWPGDPSGDPATGVATGGYVDKGRIIPFPMAGGGAVPAFKTIGTDSVPAMLTPGEIVLNAAQQFRVAGAINSGGTSTRHLEALRAEMQGVRQELRAKAERDAAERATDRRLLPKLIASAMQRRVA